METRQVKKKKKKKDCPGVEADSGSSPENSVLPQPQEDTEREASRAL